MHIEVMLMDNVKKLGKAGDIVKVAPGYFRNYLDPKGLASVVTEAAKRRLKKLEAERAARAAEEKKALLEIARKLEKLEITVSASTTDGKKLYGSVGISDILAAIEANRGVKIERGQLELDDVEKRYRRHDASEVVVAVRPEIPHFQREVHLGVRLKRHHSSSECGSGPTIGRA